MWTPRRVLLLILGMVLFSAAFGVYLHFLGGIDGLPRLPDEFLAVRPDNEPFPVLEYKPVEKKLQLAFPGGDAWHESNYHYKIELPSKGIVLAFNEFGIEDGRAKLAPFSLATFKDRPGESLFPEINTVHCDVATLEFDEPVKTVMEIGQRRIVACTLESDQNAPSYDPRRGLIHIGNNRSTPDPNDDMVLQTPGPVYYREAKQAGLPLDKMPPQLYTRAMVRLVDKRSQPQPTTIDAQGMNVFLTVEPPESAPGTPRRPAKARGGSITGVRRVVLLTNVCMDLWMDPKDGFLASAAAKPAPAQAPAAAPVERKNVQIKTLGPFTYDVLPDADHARFDRLPPQGAQSPGNCVRVRRPQGGGPLGTTYDQLECDTLEMQFANKPLAKSAATGPAPSPAAGSDHSANIDWVHAWGQHILMTSDEQNLVAHGNDLFHDARVKTTTLKGSPEMVAIKDGNEMHAPELVLYSAESKEGQQAVARGAGHFIMPLVDAQHPAGRNDDKHLTLARWRDQCIYRKDEGNDLLTLTGDASFEDQAFDRTLHADQIKLYLAPAKPGTAPAANPANGPPRARPQRLEATGNVAGRFPGQNPQDAGLTLRQVQVLVLLFKEVPPRPAAPPSTAVVAAPRTDTQPPGKAPPTPAAAAPATPAPPARPVDLKANSVQAILLVSDDGPATPDSPGGKTDLDRVHCEGDVHVHQDPPTPQERPVDISGTTLLLTHTAEGNKMFVTGPVTAPGKVDLPDLSLLGPNIAIDQVTNEVDVDGVGSMRLLTQTDFEGKKLAVPTYLTITWRQGMHFKGQFAQFHGHVEANQENKSLLCENMQVYLSRPVSLSQRPGEAKSPADSAAVDRVVCDAPGKPQGVTLTDSERDADNRLVAYRRVEASVVLLYKEEGRLEAKVQPGQYGFVRVQQRGPKGDPGGGFGPPARGPAQRGSAQRGQVQRGPAQPPEEEDKLTYVRFDDQMVVTNTSTSSVVVFRGNVDVVNLPADEPLLREQENMDKLIDKLPANALHLRSDRLAVKSTKDGQGHAHQEMQADGKAMVEWHDEFLGFADQITYDEAKQVMTLIGSTSRPARADKLRTTANDPNSHMLAERIMYNRLTGELTVIRGFSTGGR